MPRTATFDIGDIVDHTEIWGQAVVVDTDREYLVGSRFGVFNGDYIPYCYVYVFEDRIIIDDWAEDFIRCKGLRSKKKICSQCEHIELCSRIPDIVLCDISEFGQWRGEGKVDYGVCLQRRCKHRTVCVSTRFIQK